MLQGFEKVLKGKMMNLAGYVKCLKRHALNKKISDEEFFNAILGTYILAGGIDNKNKDELYFDKSRTSLILNGHDDVPAALRKALNDKNIYRWTEQKFADFVDEYMNPGELNDAVEEVAEMIKTDKFIRDKSYILDKKSSTNVFFADTLIECIKLKNDGFDPEGEIIRNGAYCVKVVYQDIFRYAFRKRSKEKNIVVIPVDTEFHTHVTRQYENKNVNEVSTKSVHGQFLTRWIQSGENLDSLIKRIEDGKKPYADDAGNCPIGTIVIIENESTIFYLIAISQFDGNNNAHSTKKDVINCVDKLSKFYDQYGDGYDIYIPLIGTGKSRASVSLQESYDILIECYKSNISRIQGNIHIVIRKDFEKYIKIDGGNGNVL